MMIAKAKLENVIGLSHGNHLILSGEQIWSEEKSGLVVAEKRKKFHRGREVKEIVLEIKTPNGSSNGEYASFVFPISILRRFSKVRFIKKIICISPNLLRWEKCGRSYRVDKNGAKILKIGN